MMIDDIDDELDDDTMPPAGPPAESGADPSLPDTGDTNWTAPGNLSLDPSALDDGGTADWTDHGIGGTALPPPVDYEIDTLPSDPGDLGAGPPPLDTRNATPLDLGTDGATSLEVLDDGQAPPPAAPSPAARATIGDDSWPPDLSENDLRRYGFYGGVLDGIDRHQQTYGRPPTDDELLDIGRSMADFHGIPLHEALGLDADQIAPAAGNSGAAAGSDGAGGETQLASGLGLPGLDPGTFLCTGSGCHTTPWSTPGGPATPPPLPPPTLPNIPPVPPPADPSPSQATTPPSSQLPGQPAEPLNIPPTLEMEDWNDRSRWVSHDDGTPPTPETQGMIDTIDNPDLRSGIRDVIFSSGTTTYAGDDGTQVQSSGGNDEASREMDDILDGLGADPKDVKEIVKPEGKVYVYVDPQSGASVIRRTFSSNGQPTLEVQIPNGNGNSPYYIKKRF